MTKDVKKLILSLIFIMVGPCFAICPLFRFFPMERSPKSLSVEAIFTINRYSSQEKTKCSFSNFTIKVKKCFYLISELFINAQYDLAFHQLNQLSHNKLTIYRKLYQCMRLS